MPQKIHIWCPHCQKRYSIPDNLGSKKLRCKKCGSSFPADEAFTSDPTLAAAPVVAEVVVVEPVQPQPPVPTAIAPDTSSFDQAQSHSQENIQGYFNDCPPSGGQQYIPRARHVSSPLMVPAVIGAVLFSLAMCGAALGYSWYQSIKAVAAAPNDWDFEDIENDSKPLLNDNASNSNSVLDSPEFATKLDEPKPDKDVDPPAFSEPDVSAEMATEEAKRQSAIEERKRKEAAREEANRKIAAERAERDKARAEERKAAKLAREKERADKKAAELAKKKAARLTPAENEKPTENLLLRVRIEGWGIDTAVVTDKLLITAEDKAIRVYNWQNKTEICEYLDIEDFDEVSSLAVSQDCSKLAVGGKNGTLGIFPIGVSGQLTKPDEYLSVPTGKRSGLKRQITNLAFNNDATRLVTVNYEKKVSFWDTVTGESIKETILPKSFSQGTAIRVVDDLAIISNDETNETFRFQNGSKKPSTRLETRSGIARAISPSGKLTAVASGSSVTICDRRGKKISEFRGSEGVNWTLCFFDENTLLCGNTGKVAMWNIKKNELFHTFEIPDASYIKVLLISPDRKAIVASSAATQDDIFVIKSDH